MKLRIKLISGVNLQAADFGGTSDPYVVFSLGEQEKRSKTVKKTVNPYWDENLEIDVTDPLRETLLFTVYDEDRINTDDAIGHAKFSLRNLYVGLPFRFIFALDGANQGEIELEFVAEGFGKVPEVLAPPPYEN